jgi:hypothetical protein
VPDSNRSDIFVYPKGKAKIASWGRAKFPSAILSGEEAWLWLLEHWLFKKTGNKPVFR